VAISASTTLLDGLVAGQPEAWRRLVLWVGPLIYYWCREAGLDPNDREDIVQEVFKSVLTGLPRFRRKEKNRNFCGWLFVVTRSRLRDLARARCKEAARHEQLQAYQRLAAISIGSAEEEAENETATRAALLRQSLEYVRGHFEPKTWQAFWRTAIDELSAVEAGEELGMSPAAVRKARSRVTSRIRQDLDELLA
jgi:RNA polymerase sigma-70 factor (ECF subfamily)